MIKLSGGWDQLDYWTSPDFHVVLEKLNAIKTFNPTEDRLFRALQMVPFKNVRVAIIGQDPYPDPRHATGIAFDIDSGIIPAHFPPTLKTIFKELVDDLYYPYPKSGSLVNWCYEGVLLWNAVPSCTSFASLSHDWPEYHSLTKEIIQKLSATNSVVFVFLGTVARRFAGYVEPGEGVLELSHPSPRASVASKSPFLGSRMFSTVNSLLTVQGLDPIDWKL